MRVIDDAYVDDDADTDYADVGDDAVEDDKWISRRYTLRADGMGHSMHETYIKPGQHLHMWYKNHRETVLCVDGEGQIEDLTEGGTWELSPACCMPWTSTSSIFSRARTA